MLYEAAHGCFHKCFTQKPNTDRSVQVIRAELQTLRQWVQSAATSGMWLLFCDVLKTPHNTM